VKFYTFYANNHPRLGLEWSGQLVDLPLAHALLAGGDSSSAKILPVPAEMLGFIRLGKVAIEAAAHIASLLKKRRAIPAGEQILYLMDEVELRAPLTRPGKIIYFDQRENGFSAPGCKLPSTVNSPKGLIKKPAFVKNLQSEIRIGAVIGAQSKPPKSTASQNEIFAYCLLNSISAEKRPGASDAFLLSNIDSFCPFAPAIITSEELQTFSVSCSLNGGAPREVEIQNLPDFSRALKELNLYIRFEPGDILATSLGNDLTFELSSDDQLQVDSPFGRLDNKVTEF
jgi:hypothetical protein